VTGARILIVNADDFGQSPDINRGVFDAHENGIVTSASLMVRWPAAGEAVEYAAAHPGISLGLHLDLAEWAYRQDQWVARYEVTPPDDEASIKEEIRRQLDLFDQLVGRHPTHIDSHQHVHRSQPVTSLLADTARSLGVPVRDMAPGITYNGEFYGQDARGYPVLEAVSVASILSIISSLQPGITELGCHPGGGRETETMYGAERALEVKTLCDPRVREAVNEHGVQLCSFADPLVVDRILPPA
jgi:chitin disaccharide deacetylase